jgi:DNA-directed RNA polymerase specialized sigma24 family protein
VSFSIVPLLLAGKTVSVEVKRALVENRVRDAAEILMREFGLSCLEASDLLDVPVC